MNPWKELTVSTDTYNFLIALLKELAGTPDGADVHVDDKALTDAIIELENNDD